MRLMEFFESENIGTFIGLRFTRDTEERLEQWLASTGINAPEPAKRFHVTLAGSQTVRIPGLSNNTLDDPIEISPEAYALDMFGDNNDTLVLRFNDQRLQDRHNEIMSGCGVKWTYPEYTPHLTMSTAPGNVDMGNIVLPDFPLFIAHEYSQPWDFSEDIVGCDRRRQIR